MTYRRETVDLPEDRGCLQWALGVPLALIYVPAAYFTVLLLLSDVEAGDDRVRDSAGTIAHVVIAISFVGLLISLLPAYRRTMNRWWYLVPLAIGLTAYLRAQVV
ncbi:hypothetical protein ACFV7Q_16105 [Streptomyces sp. NPDC059851]|uniref:hypothetical protein n=1 Tax=Streptomyces sp. NPDC059851 TaxID=3346971 RepID=UPI0036537C88